MRDAFSGDLLECLAFLDNPVSDVVLHLRKEWLAAATVQPEALLWLMTFFYALLLVPPILKLFSSIPSSCAALRFEDDLPFCIAFCLNATENARRFDIGLEQP